MKTQGRLRRLVIAIAFVYPAALLVVAALLHWVGEGWWPTSVGLYLPRIGFALPLPILVGLLLAYRERRLLYFQIVSLLIVVFPLMGFVLPWPRSAREGAPKVRVLSYNVNQQYGGNAEIFAEIERYDPDIALLQEASPNDDFLDTLRARYANVAWSSQFIIASRFPILSTTDPERLPMFGRMRSPRFMEYVIDTPIAPITFFSVHPISPRDAFHELRGAGLRHEILSGRFFAAPRSEAMLVNTALRDAQVHAIAELASKVEGQPVVIAGDTNLPGQSGILSRYLSGYRDAFSDASWGFGYTFPTNRGPWMRIDRIMASPDLRFVSFEVGRSGASDHLCVVADLQRNSQ
jgi:endonuclease/exonuclease/phosphatase (EEP) superfamily protein YafD